MSADGVEYPLDIIIFATGYDGVTGPLMRLIVAGRDGLSVRRQHL